MGVSDRSRSRRWTEAWQAVFAFIGVLYSPAKR
jgi:hypothetical protein